jgi:acyl carrier protein
VNKVSLVSENNKSISTKQVRTSEEIQEWIVSYIADLLEVTPEEINIKIPFERYGLDSSVAVGLTGDLQEWLECELDPTLLYDYPTIEAMVKHLSLKFN